MQESTLWHDANEDIHDFVLGCLERNPNQRMTAVQALKHPWLDASAPTSAEVTVSRNLSSEHLDSLRRQGLQQQDECEELEQPVEQLSARHHSKVSHQVFLDRCVPMIVVQAAFARSNFHIMSQVHMCAGALESCASLRP